MATLPTLIVNRDAPVSVYEYGGKEVAKYTFKNMDEFEAWYKGEKRTGRFLQANSQDTFTDLMLVLATPELPATPTTRKERVVTRAPRTATSVTVNGASYGSAHAAFTALGLPLGQVGRVRRQLKATGSFVFKHEGNTFTFTASEG